MNFFVYIKGILGVKTNLDSFSWVYGSVAPKSNETEFEKCKIRINLEVRKTEEIFNKEIKFEDLDKYNYFYAKSDEKKIYYERDFLFSSKLRYSVEIIDNNIINVIVNKNYYKYIKYKFMNLHSLGYILTDLASGLLLLNGYATLHCSAVNYKGQGFVIFAPPNTGKTITAIKLCEKNGIDFIAEDIALTDGTNIYSAPWTSTFRYYNHQNESNLDKFINALKKKVPFFQLISIKKRKSINEYLGRSDLGGEFKLINGVILGKGKKSMSESNQRAVEKIINLNKYEFNYHKSPTMLVMNYFNSDFSLDKMYQLESEMISEMLSNIKIYKVYSQNPMDYCEIIYDEIILS